MATELVLMWHVPGFWPVPGPGFYRLPPDGRVGAWAVPVFVPKEPVPGVSRW